MPACSPISAVRLVAMEPSTDDTLTIVRVRFVLRVVPQLA